MKPHIWASISGDADGKLSPRLAVFAHGGALTGVHYEPLTSTILEILDEVRGNEAEFLETAFGRHMAKLALVDLKRIFKERSIAAIEEEIEAAIQANEPEPEVVQA